MTAPFEKEKWGCWATESESLSGYRAHSSFSPGLDVLLYARQTIVLGKIQSSKSQERFLCCWNVEKKNPQNVMTFHSTWKPHEIHIYMFISFIRAQPFLFLWFFLDVFMLQWQVCNCYSLNNQQPKVLLFALCLSVCLSLSHLLNPRSFFGSYGLWCFLVSHIRGESWYVERATSIVGWAACPATVATHKSSRTPTGYTFPLLLIEKVATSFQL